MAESGDAMKEQQPSEAVSSPSKRKIFQEGWNALKKITSPVKESFGLGNPYPSHRQLTRREFLKEGAAVVGTAALVGAGLYSASQSPEAKTRYDAYPKPEGIPDDILTKEELQESGITVYQTKDTQLYLRRGIFDLPLFKDANERRIKGVVISLVDSDSLSWNSTSKLPSDARAIWQGMWTHPSEYPEDHWKELEKYAQDMVDRHQEIITLTQEQQRLYEARFRNMIEYGEAVLKISSETELPAAVLESARRIIKEANESLEDLLGGEMHKQFLDNLASEERQLNKFKHEQEILQDRGAAIEYMANKGDAQGLHIDTRKRKPPAYIRYRGDSPSKKMASMFHDNPQWHNKVYLYLCVKGEGLKPRPEDSYPAPDWFQTRTYRRDDKDYDVVPKELDRSVVGFFIRHEVSHYEPRTDQPPHNEHDADHLALDSISKAYDKYEETGDTQGYPFVFVTGKEITITRNMKQQQPVKAV